MKGGLEITISKNLILTSPHSLGVFCIEDIVNLKYFSRQLATMYIF